MQYGIDISEHNGEIDLTPYVGQFVIIRAAWGTNEDKMFRRNVAECQRLGIPFGVYLYSYALSAPQARSEADFLLDLINGLPINVGVWFDMEDADGYKANHGAMDSGLISSMCNEFCAEVENAGYYVGIYASQSWFGSRIVGCDKYDKWVASWGNNDGSESTNTSDMGTIHQFTSKPLDRSVMYVDINTYNGGSVPSPAPVQPSEPSYEPERNEFAVGDEVVPTADVDYNGTPVTSYHSSYTISEINGDRAVLTVGGSVWCAMNTANIAKVGGSSPAAASGDTSINVGDTVRPTRLTDYNGTAVTSYHDSYIVSELNGDRAVLTANGHVWAAMHVSDLERV